MTQTTVRWGILGTANIARSAFIPALRQTEHGRLVAVAGRTLEKTEAFAAEYDIPQVYGDYESMLASGEVDAVYNPLPNTLHLEWTAAAAKRGVHVFCEKPLAVTPEDARSMAETCREAGVTLVEAFVFLWHPQTLALRRLLDEGAIGNLLQVQCRFNFMLPRDPENIRLRKEVGGGSLLDVGSYPITFARFAFGEEPVEVQASVHVDPQFNVETRTAMTLAFSGGRQASILAGFDTKGGQGVLLYGDDGYIEIPVPFHPPEQSHFVVHTAAGSQTHRFDTGRRPFAPAIDQFHDCILTGAAPLVPADNAIGTLQVIQQIFDSMQP